MLYLEDYLEMIEHLPQELRDRFTEMRELDLSVQNNMDTIEKRVRIFFAQCRRNEVGDSDGDFVNLRKDYYKVLEDADEKVHLASQIYDLVERYLRRLDSELYKFKCELEADHNGITEILEKRSLELDGNSNSSTNAMNSMIHSSNNSGMSQKENRYFGAISASGGGNNQIGNHSGQSVRETNSSNNRYHRHKAEKRRDSNNGPVIGQPPEKRQMISTGLNHNNLGLINNNTTLNSLGLAVSSSNLRPTTPNVVQQHHGHHSHIQSHAVIAQSPTIQSNSHLQTGVNQIQIRHSFGSTGSSSLSSTSFNAENELVKAASQAINLTQQMQQGRRTASLKASVEAAGLSSQSELLGRELAGAAHNAIQAIQEREGNSSFSSNQRRQKKKLSSLSSASSSMSSAPSSSLQLPSLESTVPSITMNENGMIVEQTPDGEWTFDPNEPRYCICNQVSYGDMVACDNEVCPFEWFHYPCVGITQSPKGKWYCPHCTSSMKRRKK